MSNTINSLWDKITGFLANRNFYKATKGRYLQGVCQGLANKTSINVDFIRLVFVISTIVSFGTTILVYIALALVMPDKKENTTSFNNKNYGNKGYVDGRAWEKK